MRRTPLAPLLLGPILFVAACAGSSATPSPSAPAPVRDRLTLIDAQAEYDALPWRDTFGDWTPSADDLALAARVGTPDGDAALDALPLEDRVRVLRAGLRLDPGPASYACVRKLSWKWLDVGEHAVAVDHLVAELLDPTVELPKDQFWQAIEFFGAADVPRILAVLPEIDVERLERAEIVTLHKVVHAEHIPALVACSAAFGRRVPEQVDWLPATLPLHSDQHRDLLNGGWFHLHDASRSGLPAPLVHELRQAIDDPEYVANDAFRWLVDARPAPHDVELLLRGADDDGRAEYIWSLRHLRDPRIDGRLSQHHQWTVADPELMGEADFAAAALLVERGSAAALPPLRHNARNDADAFAFLVHAAPDTAFDLLVDVIRDESSFEPADPSGERPIEALLTTTERARFWGPSARFHITWPIDRWADVESALLASPASWRDLVGAARAHPELRTQELLAEAYQRFGVPPRSEDDPFFDEWELDPADLVLFELAFRDALHAKLIEASADDRVNVSESARTALRALGDPRPLFWPASPRERPDVDLVDPSATQQFVERARALLSTEQEDERFWPVVQWLAERDGFPSTVPFDQVPGPMDTAELRRDVVAAVLAHRPVDAFTRLLEALPDEVLVNEGDVDDPRVRAHLVRLRDTRHLGQYAHATAELAIAGDPAARSEQWKALRRGLYRWCDDMDARTATLGNDLGLVDYWARFTEASCCQQPTGRAKLDDAFDLPELDSFGYGWTTLDAWRRWAAPRTGRFAWSRISGTFHMLPR